MKNKKVHFFFGDYQPSEKHSAILEGKSGKKTNVFRITALFWQD
jgi:hypothetical protein